jgi:hypothetical protein
MPSFLISVIVAGLGVFAAAEEEGATSQEGCERDYVPGVFGEDVGGDEVDFSWKIGEKAISRAALHIEVVKTFHEVSGAFDLDAP